MAMVDALMKWSDTNLEFRAHLRKQIQEGLENLQMYKRAAEEIARLLNTKPGMQLKAGCQYFAMCHRECPALCA